MSRKPDTRLASLVGIARRQLNIATEAAASACGRSQETVSALEAGIHRMADEPCRKLILHYLDKLEHPVQQPMLPLDQLVEELARAILLHRIKKATELLAAAESGAQAVVLAVCLDGLHAVRISDPVSRRMRYRLAVEERKRTEESA